MILLSIPFNELPCFLSRKLNIQHKTTEDDDIVERMFLEEFIDNTLDDIPEEEEPENLPNEE